MNVKTELELFDQVEKLLEEKSIKLGCGSRSYAFEAGFLASLNRSLLQCGDRRARIDWLKSLINNMQKEVEIPWNSTNCLLCSV